MNVFSPKTTLALALWVVAAACQASDLAIINARIEVGNGTVIPTGSVLIHDGKIVAVGPELSIPGTVEVIDAKGMVVYPGFIDAYTTKGLKLPAAPAAGPLPDSRTTAMPTMWHDNRKGIHSDIIAAKCLDLGSQLKDNYKQGITTALIAPDTGSIRGIGSVVDYVDAGAAVQPNALVDLSFRGEGGGGGRQGGGGGAGTGYPGTLFGVIAEIRQTLADAQTYTSIPPAKKDAVYENLKPLVAGQMPGGFVADSEREIVRAQRIADEFGFKLLVIGGREAYKDVDIIHQKNEAVIVNSDIGLEPSKTASQEPDSAPQPVVDERYTTWQEHSLNIKDLCDAGVPVALSTMGSTDDYLKNVRRVIATGVSRDTALKAMTLGCATILGVADKVGSIETGKIANLVIMNGDFVNDKSEVQSVIVEGKKVDVKKAGAK
jgi:hypothetical protein